MVITLRVLFVSLHTDSFNKMCINFYFGDTQPFDSAYFEQLLINVLYQTF